MTHDLQTRPPSHAIWMSRCLWFGLIETNSLIRPARRTLRNIANRRRASNVIPRMLPTRMLQVLYIMCYINLQLTYYLLRKRRITCKYSLAVLHSVEIVIIIIISMCPRMHLIQCSNCSKTAWGLERHIGSWIETCMGYVVTGGYPTVGGGGGNATLPKWFRFLIWKIHILQIVKR